MFDKIKNLFIFLSDKLNTKISKYIIFLIYLVITFILVLNHEVWMDEAQSWELARNLSIPDLIYQMRFEGHSCLWHLILMPFAKMNFPIITINIISFIFVSIAVYMILFKASWNIFVKVIIIFSPAFLYYLSVISRCYSLIPILLYFLVTYYDKRHEHPIIYSIILGLLAHTHIIMCPIVGIAATLYLIECVINFKEKKKNLFVSLFVLGIFFVLLMIQLAPSLNGGVAISYNYNYTVFLRILKSVCGYFLPNIITDNAPWMVLIIFLLILIVLFKYKKSFAFIYLVTFIVFIYIHLHWSIVLYERCAVLFVLFAILNLYNTNKFNQIILFMISLVSISSLGQYIYCDMVGPFSASKEMGEWVNENVKDGSLIIFLNMERDVSVPAYVTKNIDYYDIRLDSFRTYIDWQFIPYMDYHEILTMISRVKSDYKNIYLMHNTYGDYTDENVEDIIDSLTDVDVIELMFSSYSNKFYEEQISIYKLIKI